MLDVAVIQGRGFRNVLEDGRVTGFQFQLRNPNYRGVAASLLDGIDVVVDGERIPEHVPLWTLQGRTFTLDELRASTDVRWQLDEPATITVPKPGGLSVGVHRLEVTLYLRRSYFPPMVSRTPFTVGRHGRHRAAGPGGRPALRRLDLQLHRGRLHLDDARGRLRRHRRPRRHRHRDPRRGQHPELPDADLGVDRRRGTGCWSSYGLTADQLRVLGRHHPLARPRPDRRGGGRAAPAGPAAGQGARLHLGAAEVRRHLLGAGPAPDLAGSRRAVAGPGRRARRRHLPGDPRADADQAPGDPGLRRLHREDRHRALQAAHRHRHLQHRAGRSSCPRRSRSRRARRSRRTCGRSPSRWPTWSRCCRTCTSSRPSSSRWTTT